jgi:hypothetical protein
MAFSIEIDSAMDRRERFSESVGSEAEKIEVNEMLPDPLAGAEEPSSICPGGSHLRSTLLASLSAQLALLELTDLGDVIKYLFYYTSDRLFAVVVASTNLGAGVH